MVLLLLVHVPRLLHGVRDDGRGIDPWPPNWCHFLVLLLQLLGLVFWLHYS